MARTDARVVADAENAKCFEPHRSSPGRIEPSCSLTTPIDKRNRNIKNHGQKFTLRLVKQLARLGRVTLLCHCAENQTRCHRHVLRKLLLSSRV